MIVKSIELYNYRLYYGLNRIDFQEKGERNLFLILGENGFGKTTFLHSLIWCLYGRSAVDVDLDVYRDISGYGYSEIQKNNLNVLARTQLNQFDEESKRLIKKNGYGDREYEKIRKIAQYYVSIEFSDVMIPSVPCKSLRVVRAYDCILEKEKVEVFIDGQRNELSNEIGPEMFINDFVLSKDIARFFFFDSERIVSMAETDTKNSRQKLCSAYNEILGVKKYEDLRNNLLNLRLKFRKNTTDISQKIALEQLLDDQTNMNNKINEGDLQSQKISNEIASLRQKNEELQLKMLREGNEATVDEYRRLNVLIEKSRNQDEEYKKSLKTYLEYAPFAVAGKLFQQTKDNLSKNYKILKSHKNAANQKEIVEKISTELFFMVEGVQIENIKKDEIKQSIKNILQKYEGSASKEDLSIKITKESYDEFIALYNYIISTYKLEFERLADDYKKNRLVLERSSRRLSKIQQKESDEVIKGYRIEKNKIEEELKAKEMELTNLHEELGINRVEYDKLCKKVEELSKKVSIEARNIEKDNLSEQLISELDSFLQTLRLEKKSSLERQIKSTLNNLMHKSDFISNVEVISENGEMDIKLYDVKGRIINKDLLSKGEQQLYATALLKSLVEESGVEFPVFIDSPLQKFDKSHADKIISEFYPTISKQVILFPLLYKEVGVAELTIMKPRINEVYKIHNEVSRSTIKKFDINQVLN